MRAEMMLRIRRLERTGAADVCPLLIYIGRPEGGADLASVLLNAPPWGLQGSAAERWAQLNHVPVHRSPAHGLTGGEID